MPKYCPNCGHQVDGGALFCDNCGTKLRERPNTPPEPQPQQPVQPPQQPTAQTVLPQQQPVQPIQTAQQPGQQMPPPPPAGGQYGYPAPQPPVKKKSGVAVVIIIVVALLMALTAVIGFIAYRAYKRYVASGDTCVVETTVQDVPATAPSTAPGTSEAPETTTAPLATAPRFDDVERPEASDFAWMADGDSVFESGPELDSAAILGKWKCEIVYNGIWELATVTIDADGSIVFVPHEINYGDGWENEEGAERYLFSGEVTEGSASGSGKYGSINLFKFTEIGGVQYGKGLFHVNDYGSCDVYLVRP